MGPNGSGKSTTAATLAGHPTYSVTSGDMLLDGESLLEKSPDDGDTQATVRFQLKDTMATDESFTLELANILKEASEAGVDTIFHTTILGDVQNLVQMGNVYGNVKI